MSIQQLFQGHHCSKLCQTIQWVGSKWSKTIPVQSGFVQMLGTSMVIGFVWKCKCPPPKTFGGWSFSLSPITIGGSTWSTHNFQTNPSMKSSWLYIKYRLIMMNNDYIIDLHISWFIMNSHQFPHSSGPVIIQPSAAQHQGASELLAPGITAAQGSRRCKGCMLVARRGVQGVNQPHIQTSTEKMWQKLRWGWVKTLVPLVNPKS